MYFDKNLTSTSEKGSRTERLFKILEAITDSSHDGIMVTDGTGTIIAYNEASARFVGVPPEMLLGKSIHEIDNEPYISGSVTKEALEKQRLITHYKKMPLTGKLLLITAKPIFDQNGNLEFVIVNDRDMTSTIETQTELKKSKENLKRLREDIRVLTSYDKSQNELICQSPEFIDVVKTALMLATLDESNILLLGESGTGKGKLARIIHRNSNHDAGAFIHINCAALPEALLEAELFGYEKGAFTGASRKGKIGLMELADKGTLFLDEIADMPLPVQSKLLISLDTRQITRLGGTKSINVDCKIIAATNRDLHEMVAAKKFRSDLLYRLNTFSIEIPPLRERIEDLFELTIHFLGKYNKKYRKNCRVGPFGFQQMSSYRFPGNVRELENIIKRAVVLTDEGFIDDTIAQYIQRESSDNHADERHHDQPLDLKHMAGLFEKMVIMGAMKGCKNTRQLAQKLNVSHATIIRKMQRAGITFQATSHPPS
jgi:PAS domain S-box-containing protein